MIFSGTGLSEDTITTRIRVRGNFRKKICYFKPMRLEIRKNKLKIPYFKGIES